MRLMLAVLAPVAAFLALQAMPYAPAPEDRADPLPPIAHAGGALDGMTYTNSHAALDANARRYDLFEIDLIETTDGAWVCLHDWDVHAPALLGTDGERLTLAAFEARAAASDTQPCTLGSLAAWMRANPHARLVTDVKGDNLAALAALAREHADLVARTFPEVFTPGEAAAARALGFERLIWSLYRHDGGDDDVLARLNEVRPTAIAMPVIRARKGLGAKLRARGVPVYVHTVNDEDAVAWHRARGVGGIYTDALAPAWTHDPFAAAD